MKIKETLKALKELYKCTIIEGDKNNNRKDQQRQKVLQKDKIDKPWWYQSGQNERRHKWQYGQLKVAFL